MSVSAGVRRVADEVGRLAPGRELFRRLAPGRVLAVDAVRGLAVAPFWLAAGLAAPDLAPPFWLVRPFWLVPLLRLALPVRAAPDLAGLALAAPFFDEPFFAATVFALLVRVTPAFALVTFAAPALAGRPLLPPDLAAPALTPDLAAPDLADFAGPDLAVLALAPVSLMAATLMPAAFFMAPDETVPGLTVLALTRAAGAGFLDWLRAAEAEPARLAAGRAAVTGPATDSDFAAAVRALAAELIALVAVFMDCMAVDIVFADEVARLAAAFIFVAAEVTLVAAEDTVRAALADAVPVRTDMVRVPPERAGLRATVTWVRWVRWVRWAPVAVVRLVLRTGRAAGRADGLAPVDLAAALVVGRAAER